LDDKPPKTGRPGSRYGRRIAWLGVLVVLLLGGYTAAWFHFAGRLEEQARIVTSRSYAGGASVECENPQARGYPFRIGIYCDQVAFSEVPQGARLSAGSFRSAAQVYDPKRIVAELDGPASIDLPGADPLALAWQGLRASVRLAKPLPDRVSVETSALSAKNASGDLLATVDAFQAHFRPNGRAIDLAARFERLAIDPRVLDARSLPPLSGQSDLSIDDGVQLAGKGLDSLRGQSGTLRLLDLSTAEGKTGVALSGPFSIAGDGLVDADLSLVVRDAAGIATVLSEAFPEARDRISLSLSGLAALGPETSLPLKIERGRATLGFIPLGEIPPLE
jgi:hypothetical protein